MTEIIFHIGLPKSMSSTLQRSVFAHEEGYLGTMPGGRLQENFAKSLQECTPFGGRFTTNWKCVERWSDRIRDSYPHQNRFLLSNEILATSNRLSDRPIIDFLDRFNRTVWREGQVKAMIVLRNQLTSLASGYAQSSQSRLHPSQADFERDVGRYLKRRARMLDYTAWVDGLQSALGKENVGVFFVEESRQISFWDQLQSFCQLEHLDVDKMLGGGSNHNKKAHRQDNWAISPLDLQFKAKVIVDKPLNLLWPKRVARGFRAKVRGTTISILAGLYDVRAKRREPHSGVQRCTEIRLTPEVESLLWEHVGESNKKLANQLGKDLKNLGYF